MFGKIKKVLVIIMIVFVLLISFGCFDVSQNKEQLKTINYVSMLTGIERNTERIDNECYYARLYHESNFPDVQEYNIICFHNNKQVVFRLNDDEEFVHNIKCEANSKNYYEVQISNIENEVNDFLFLFIRDPERHYDEPIMPQKLNIANRSIFGIKQDSFYIEDSNIVSAEVNEYIYPGVWILDNHPGQYFMPSIDLDISEKKTLTLAYRGKSNKNICFIPIVNYRQTHLKINDKIMSYVKVPYIQNGGLIDIELVDELKNNSIFFMIAIEDPIDNSLSDSVWVSNRITIVRK